MSVKKSEFKVNIDGVEEVYFVRQPSDKIQRQAAEYKAEVFKREAFKPTAVFADQVYSLMREKGIWTDSDEAELKRVSKELEDKLTLLSKGKTKEIPTVADLRRVIVDDVKKLRAEQFKLLAKSNRYHDITVEAITEEAENDYLTAHCTFTEGDTFAFASQEDPTVASLDAYINANDTLKFESARQVAILMGTNDPDWALKLPENKILQKHKLLDEKGFYVSNGVRVNADGKPVNDKGQLINDKGDLVDNEGNIINEEGEPVEYTAFDEETVTQLSTPTESGEEVVD